MRSPLPDGRLLRLGTGISSALVGFLWMTAGCAQIEGDPPIDTGEAIITVACANDLTDDNSILPWQLEVVPKTVVSGEPFTVGLDGKAVFPEDFLDQAQPLIPGGVEEVNLVALNATVHVRSGASGDDVILTADPNLYEYECAQRSVPCDPANDLPSVPGQVGNTDCEGETASNPCGRFVKLPISSECFPDGACDKINKTGPASQCELNDFCITDDLVLSLGEATGKYTADSEERVLFGWDDGESTGATVVEDPDDPNFGTWILPEAVYDEEPGPISIRLTVVGFPIALECTMGVDSKGPYGVDSLDFLSSPTPSSLLTEVPIGEPF